MKICIFTHTLPRFLGDPSAPFIDELASSLSKLGNKVTVLAPYDISIDLTWDRPYEIVYYKYIIPNKFHILGYSRTLRSNNRMNAMSLFLSPLLYIFGFFALLRLVKDNNIDVISSHWIIPNGFIASLVSIITKIPHVTTIPGSDVYMASKNLFFTKMAKFATHNAGVVVSDSKYYFQQLNNLDIYPIKTEIIPYGVNSEKFKIEKLNKALISKFDIKGKKVLLAVGRLVEKKGFGYLIDAMPKIIENFPEVKLIIVGDGVLREKLENKVKQIGLGNNIIFMGQLDYRLLHNYYNLADIFIMPSIKDKRGNIDASPVSLMIAMMSGCQVVVTKYALNEVSIGRGIGYVIQEQNTKEISKAVISILKKKDIRKSRSIVRGYAKKHFSVVNSAKRYLYLFRKVVDPLDTSRVTKRT